MQDRRLPVGHRLGRQTRQPRAGSPAVGDAPASSPARSSCCPRCSPPASACTSTRSPNPPTGRRTRFWPSLAREHRACVVGGVVTRAADGRGRNDAVVCGPDGKLLVRYCQDAPVLLRRRDETLPGGRAVDDVRLARFRGLRRSSATTCGFRKSFARQTRAGRRAAGRDRQLARSRARRTGWPCSGPGHRKPGLRRGRQPRRQRSQRALRRARA